MEENRVYVGSISYSANEGDVHALFSQIGPIQSITMPRDRELDRHKGFAFVAFHYPQSAYQAIASLDGYEFAGRNLRVSRPQNPAVTRGDSSGGHAGGHMGGHGAPSHVMDLRLSDHNPPPGVDLWRTERPSFSSPPVLRRRAPFRVNPPQPHLRRRHPVCCLGPRRQGRL